jgi:hypothetical protein
MGGALAKPIFSAGVGSDGFRQRTTNPTPLVLIVAVIDGLL